LLSKLGTLCVQMGTDNELKGKQGRFQCFVAYDLDASNRLENAARSRGSPGADVPPFFKFLLAEPLRVCPCSSITKAGIPASSHLWHSRYAICPNLQPRCLESLQAFCIRCCQAAVEVLYRIERGTILLTPTGCDVSKLMKLCRLGLSCLQTG